MLIHTATFSTASSGPESCCFSSCQMPCTNPDDTRLRSKGSVAGPQQQLVAHIRHKIIADNGARIRDETVRLERDASKQDECLNMSKGVYGFGDASPRFASPAHDDDGILCCCCCCCCCAAAAGGIGVAGICRAQNRKPVLKPLLRTPLLLAGGRRPPAGGFTENSNVKTAN